MSRIVNNSSANTVFKTLNRSGKDLAASAERLATGLRINRASDDASGLAISETLRAQVKGSAMAQDNIANANNFINTADGFLQNISDILGRLEELAVQYGDPTKSEQDKENIEVEFEALKVKAGEIFENAQFNGVNIFEEDVDEGLIIDANGTAVSIAGLDGGDAAAAVDGADVSDVESIQEAINTVSTQRGTLGASQSVLNFTLIGLENYTENISAAESRIRDVDVARETTNFSRSQIQVQAATAMLAQANALPQSVLRLIG